MSNDLVRYRQEEVHLGGGDVEYRYVESKDGWIASYADAKAALDAQAAEIARLRAELATARREGMDEAAKRLEELHRNHKYNPKTGEGREHDVGYYRAISEGVAHILYAAAGEGKP